jgi:hypothetical protein
MDIVVDISSLETTRQNPPPTKLQSHLGSQVSKLLSTHPYDGAGVP